MVLESSGAFSKSVSKRLIIAVLSLGLSIMWVLLMAQGRLPFDAWMSPYWGGGFNPPSVNFMVYSVFILFLCYSTFSLLSEYGHPVALRKLIDVCSFLGRNTLYIWLYHMHVSSFLANKCPGLRDGNLLMRILALGTIVTLPVIVKQLIELLLRFYCKQVYQLDGK